MITNALPDIPRSYTAICEWAACVVYIAVLFRRVPPRRSVVVSAIGLAALIAVQYFDGSMPIWFWIVGMLLAFGCMYLTILFGAGTGKREGLYITARVRTGRTGGVAALADRHVHRHAQRPIRGLRLACRLTARCHLRIVFRPGLAGRTRQFQPDRAHVADGFRGDRDGGHHDRHLRHEQPELHFDQYAILRFDGPGNLLHPHTGGFLRIRDSIRATGAGSAH